MWCSTVRRVVYTCGHSLFVWFDVLPYTHMHMHMHVMYMHMHLDMRGGRGQQVAGARAGVGGG